MINASCKSLGEACRHAPPSVHCLQNKVAVVGKVKPSWPQTKSVFLTSGCTHSSLPKPVAADESSQWRNFTSCREGNKKNAETESASLRAAESQHSWAFHWVTHQYYVTLFIWFCIFFRKSCPALDYSV